MNPHQRLTLTVRELREVVLETSVAYLDGVRYGGSIQAGEKARLRKLQEVLKQRETRTRRT